MPCMLIAMATHTHSRRAPEGVLAAVASSPMSQVQARTVPESRLGRAFRPQWLKRVSYSDMESTSAMSREVPVAHIACHWQPVQSGAMQGRIIWTASSSWPMFSFCGGSNITEGSVRTDAGLAKTSQQVKETPSSAPVAERGKRFWLARSHQKLLDLVQQETAARGSRRGLFGVRSETKRDAWTCGESR